MLYIALQVPVIFDDIGVFTFDFRYLTAILLSLPIDLY